MATAGMRGELPINTVQHDLSTEEGSWEGAPPPHRDAHEGTTGSLSDAECPPQGGRCPGQRCSPLVWTALSSVMT